VDPFVFFVFVLVVVFVLVGVLLLVAFTRKGSVSTVAMTRRRIVLHSAAPPGAVYGWLTQYCPTGYSVEDADPARGVVLFSSRLTAFSYGFFYPAVVSAEGAGTRVDLGIKSKVFQYGPVVTRAHRKLAQALAGLTQSRVEGG
jgi:hypothetical protein